MSGWPSRAPCAKGLEADRPQRSPPRSCEPGSPPQSHRTWRLSSSGSLSSTADPGPHRDDQAWADALWESISGLPDGRQRLIAKVLRNERSWALAVRICEASAAASQAGEALRLAKLAVDIADDTEEPLRTRLLGWCVPFLAHASRAAGDLDAAREAAARADALWEQGAGGDPQGLLDGSRRLGVGRVGRE